MHWSFWENLPIALAVAWLWTLLAFLVGRVVHRHATVDVFWGAGFVVLYLESLLVAHVGQAGASFGVRYVALALVAAWGLRLTFYLARRQRGAKEDLRYVFIMKGARGRNETIYALRMIYGLQGLLLWFVSMPLQWIAFRHGFDALFAPGLCLVAIGVFFEATGDEQLRRFIKDPATRGTTMKRGLWRYTRHPNYFGDAVVWCGLWLLGCSHWLGVLTLAAPVYMTNMLVRHTGKKLLEKHMARSKGAAYADYVSRTSGFIPWPPR